MSLEIYTPQTPKEFQQYYDLRWQILRKPWRQAKGSEQDELEKESIHRMAIADKKIVAVGRLHFANDFTAQVRYMAVAKEYEKQGYGKAILKSLEEFAKEKKVKLILLHARESALGFYENQGYTILKKSHLLFNEIQHYEMQKILK